jgi:hypothetical protein
MRVARRNSATPIAFDTVAEASSFCIARNVCSASSNRFRFISDSDRGTGPRARSGSRADRVTDVERL